MDRSDTNNDAYSINEDDTTTSGPSSQLNVTMKRRSFSHDYYGSGARCASDVNDDGDSEVRLTSSAQLHPLSHEHGDDNSMLQPTSMENSTLSRQQRQKHRQSKSFTMSERRRCRTQGDVLVMGADDTINRERANTCPQHQFHHDLDERDEDEDLLSVIYSGEDEEAGGVGMDDETHRRLHGSDSNERRTQSLPSSTLLSPEHQSISSYTPSVRVAAPSSPRRRAASASSIISSLQQHTSTATTLLHTTSSTTTTSSSISSYTSTTIKHTLLKLLMLISIYQLLSYTYNTGLSPDVKYQLGEINYDIEEYWNGGRLWSLSSSGSSNRLSASRIVGSSGISFNDDYDVGGNEDEEEGVVGFISSIWSEKFGNQDEGGEGVVDVEEEERNVEVVAFANGASNKEGEAGVTNLSSSRGDSTTVKKKSEEPTTPIIVANSNNITKRRPAMAHVISISENRHPVYLPRASSSRRMKSNDVHWTFSRIAGAIIWIGLMIPILEVGIREVSRRYRLGSLLRRRLRMLRGGYRRRSPENVHIL